MMRTIQPVVIDLCLIIFTAFAYRLVFLSGAIVLAAVCCASLSTESADKIYEMIIQSSRELKLKANICVRSHGSSFLVDMI